MDGGYHNMLTKYGTSRDSSEYYQYAIDGPVDDTELTSFYEQNGIFARIIDAPAEEAVKHGFELEGLEDDSIQDFVDECLDELDWEETAMQCLKWARLFGGSIAVLLINDGRGLEEPVLALTLLMLGILADHHDFALALDDLALLAHGLHGRSDFHFFTSKSVRLS